MKIPKAIATFFFSFKDIHSKDESIRRLKEFLLENDNIDENGNYKKFLDTKNTYDDGICRIILTDDSDNSNFQDHVNKLFKLLKDTSDIKVVKILLNEYTREIFYNNVDFYPDFQNKEIQDMEDGDIVVVYVNPK